ncbi:MAG: division/cell wall cluster transcriptional repressor MraZ [Melioribacteraceae bacterium]|nr:division/cell wall cluster transcriptional repressor MraZ [Melioribacteraceae bacterium]
MFLGSFKYSIDNKCRISIPATMRKFVNPEANNTFVMTRGTEPSIIIYPSDLWKLEIASKLDKLNPFDPKDSKFLRMFLHPAAEAKFDTQSRLMIPKNLIEYAGIKKDILIIGMNQFIEVWNPERYDSYLRDNNEPYEEIAKEVMKI